MAQSGTGGPRPGAPFTSDFHLSITKALADQLSASLAKLEPAQLSDDTLAGVAPRGGVYQLFYNTELVYIGKADRNLADRLRQHKRKITGRENIRTIDIAFTALYVDEDLSAVAPETLLINQHRTSGALPWNFNGFGNKDPGRERDTSAVEDDHFDRLYPADLEFVCETVTVGRHLVGDVLVLLKRELPYVFRYAGGNRSKSSQPREYWENSIDIPAPRMSAIELFKIIASAMPGWQITALPGYVIMYKERRQFPSQRWAIYND